MPRRLCWALLVASAGCGTDDVDAVGAWVPVGSREYKVVLDEARFAGDPGAAAESLWGAFAGGLSDDLGLDTSGHLDHLDKERRVRFFDTPGSCRLAGADYVLREREHDDGREITLKFRSADRAVAMARDMASPNPAAESKFEEDISPPFVSRFSASTTVPVGDEALASLRDPVALVPGLAGPLGSALDEPLAVVGGEALREEVWGTSSFDLGLLDAEVSVTLWYVDATPDPVLAEASFRVEQVAEAYPEADTARAAAAFDLLQRLDAWVDLDAPTKTAFAYDLDPTFCE